ncbi:MAG: hypothetical protein ABEJ25_02185 [Candidatus Bipolaricaulia bacterium]
MSIDNSKKVNIEENIRKLEGERFGKVMRKIFWLFVGGDTDRWFGGKPRKQLPKASSLEKGFCNQPRHFSTEFVASRVYRANTVNFELAPDKRDKIDEKMKKLEKYGLVERVKDEDRDNQCWKLTRLGYSCALAVKEDIEQGNRVNWDLSSIKSEFVNLKGVKNF